ncbi:hypothetical protein UK23_34030 [Lentzea aerocolonigenes]|uniref:Uncharacterized protein n=2 Tax=Lentzea aerocolonigenes TaxID=68170 RepID=A0A0F0GP64_LENAE|nr:hypothetical protein UK23_34030 [Lentzea aerocolonigenes]
MRAAWYSLVSLATGSVLVWLDWHAGSANPAVPVNRATMIVTVLVLTVLPWVLGPVAPNRTARIVRVTGYASIYALLAALTGLSRYAGSRFDHFTAFDQANWEADVLSGAVVGGVLMVLVIGGYAVAVLTLTSRRMAVEPKTLAVGVFCGLAPALSVYAFMPVGNLSHAFVLAFLPPAALLAAGVLARQGVVAGLCAGGAAALVLATLTIATMVLLPGQVDLEWANPDPAAPHGTLFELQMSVGDAAVRYQLGLVLGPFAGLVCGFLGSSFTRPGRVSERANAAPAG